MFRGTQSEVSQRYNLVIAAVSALFCLTPLFCINEEKKFSTDDTISSEQIIGVLQYSPSLMAPLFVILIPAIDLVLDITANVSSHFCPTRKLSRKPTEVSVVVRLHDVERLLFIMGVGIQSSVWFLSSSVDLPTLAIVYGCTYYASILLVLGPILTFLQRSTITFTTLRSSVVIITTAVGLVIWTMCSFFRNDEHIYKILNYVGGGVLAIPAIICSFLMTFCAYKYCCRKLRTASDRQALITWLCSSFRRNPAKVHEKIDKQCDSGSELYSNYIPALHMVAGLTIVIAISYVSWVSNGNLAEIYERRNYVTLAAEIIVLVIELRIRKNEIARGLLALLESKRSYVRYISHELRTPLNTAFLGLKLLSNELKASKDIKDVERYDTLCDVNMSCMAAVDILNDLLCYEKLESGIQELHKENIAVDPFLRDCITMFSVQARECGVAISLVTDFPVAPPCVPPSIVEGPLAVFQYPDRASPRPVHPLSLQPEDVIFADKFKMDQVVRNLISNSLKFTPRGGTVTIKASFAPDEEDPRGRLSRTQSERSVHREIMHYLYPRSPGPRGLGLDLIATFSASDLSISCEEQPTRGKLVVVVTDTGAGMSPENQGRLFKEIVQFSPETLQAGGGSGLGLWITSGIIELHGGNISVYSEGEGLGSAFTVHMPMLRHPTTPPPPHVPCNSPSKDCGYGCTQIEEMDRCGLIKIDSIPSFSALSSTSNVDTLLLLLPHVVPTFHVLVVDDSPLNRKMLLKCLRADGHTCMEATDGLEAVALVKDKIDYANGGEGKPFDAILMDFVMPNMDGPTATKEIRALGYTAPIFGVTGNGLPSDVSHFLWCGADKVLLKPLDVTAFARAMEERRESDQT